MPPPSATPAALKALAVLAPVLLAPAAAAGTPPAGVAAPPPVADRSDGGLALAAARDRSARAEAALEGLRRAMSPAHVTDPRPGVDRPFGLDAARAEYADMQRRVAGYRATLGEHHPTLVAAEQVLADLRGQLLDGTRRALASAEREAVAARAEVEAVARAAAARPEVVSGDATGSVAPDPRPAPRPRIDARARPRDPVASPAPAGEPASARPTHPFGLGGPSPGLLGAAAAGSAALVAISTALSLFRSRRRGRRPAMRRIEPGLDGGAIAAAGAALSPAEVDPHPADPHPVDAVPVLATLPLAADAAEAPARGAAGGAADALHATLRDAFGRDGRMTVLLSPATGLTPTDADGAAVALALAAAAAGRRVLLMEARAEGRLRRSLVADDAPPALVEVAGTVRSLYRLDAAGVTVALLPSDAGEAEAARDAERRACTARLAGLSTFDTVLVLCDPSGAGTLARGADLALVVAPDGATAADLAAAAEPLRAADRPCGALLVGRPPAAPVAAVPVAAWSPPAPRRRSAADPAPVAARLGLRGSFEPARRRRGA